MPASSTASSFSKTHRTSHTPSKQDTDHEDLREAPEEPLAPPQSLPAASVNRRVRPLSETRSYHSIFSSVRGSARNVVKTLPFRVRVQDKEDKEENEENISTTPPPVEETTTMEVVPETKEPDNDLSPLSEDQLGYEEEPLTSLKSVTPSPTKSSFNHPKPPAKRPVKIRVHQKPISKTNSSTSSSSSPSSSPSSSLSSSSLHIQESAAGRKDYGASTVTQSKNTYDKPSITHKKPSTTVEKKTNPQQIEATPVSKGSALAGRNSGSGFGSRYVNNRRQPGILLRGNSTRTLNGYKFPITSRSNLPNRTVDQARLNPHSSAISQSTLPEGSQNHKTSHTFNSATSTSNSGRASNSQASSDASNLDKLKSTSESRSHGSTTSHISDVSSSTSQSSSGQPSSTDKPYSSKSTSHRASHSSATSHNTHNSPEQDNNEDAKNRKTTEDPTSSSKTKSAEEQRKEQEEKDKGTNENPVVSRTRISTSFAERFPWLASRYPGRFSSGNSPSSPRQNPKTLSSVGGSRPILRETPTRVSGATGAAGLSLIQKTSEDVRSPLSHDSLKNGVGAGSGKMSLSNQNTASSNNRKPTASSSSSGSSSESASSSSHQSTSEHRDSSEPKPVGTFRDNNKDGDKDYTNERSTGITRKNEKGTDSRVAQSNPAISGANPHRNGEDNDSVDTSETRIRSETFSVVSPSHRNPGVNGRIRSSLNNRQFGGSRFSVKPKPVQNSRQGSSRSDSSSLSDSLWSSNLPQSVLTSNREAGTGTTVAKTGGLTGSSSQSASSSLSRDSFRGLGVRSRNPVIRGTPTNGGALQPGNGNGKVS